MEYRYLGRTGVRVSPICVGTMTYGDKTDQGEADRIVAAAIDDGINFFDTANVYVGGESEQVFGKAVAKTKMREHLFIATKCHGNMHKGVEMNPNQWGNSRRQIIEQANASLERLGMDHVDLLQIHRPHPDCAIDETLRALDDLVTAGKVRYIGCSTFAAWQVVESLWAAERYGLNRFVTEQPPYHLLDRRIERELIPMCRTFGLGVLPWSPLASGFLTGKYRRDQKPEQGRMADSDYFRNRLLSNDRAYDAIEALEKLAADKGCNVGQLALSWCMHQPGVTSPIIGPRNLDQYRDNVACLDVQVTDEDRRRIDEISPPGGVIESYYDAAFGPHPHRF